MKAEGGGDCDTFYLPTQPIDHSNPYSMHIPMERIERFEKLK